MNKNMIEAMQRDLHMYPYKNESSSCYYGRLMYSALSSWIRFCIMDKTTEQNDSKSKAYVLSRGKEILRGFIECIPECKPLIAATDGKFENRIEEMVTDIRNKMIYGGELVELTTKINIGLPERKCQPCTNGIVRVMGELINERCQAAGITRIQEDVHSDGKSLDFISIIGIDDYITDLYKKARWSNIDDISRYEIFNSMAKRAPYKSWENQLNKSMKYQLIRMSLYNDMHEYYLVKIDNGKMMTCRMDELLAEGKEERRIILGLRKMYGNQMDALYEYKGSVVLLKLFCRLPLREEHIIETYCWPERSFDDKLNYLVPFKIWDEIKELLESGLGIILKEKE